MSAPIAIDQNELSSDEGYEGSTNTSYLTSIASSIRKTVLENGRAYASYGKELQGLPVDEQEMDRNDLQHAKFLLMLGGEHYMAPIGESPGKILDLGTGSGIWSIDIADKFPAASVTGVDIAPTQPTWVPPNVQFEIEDIEEDWLHEKDSFDFIFGRELMMAIHDYPQLIKRAYDHLKPGGYLELEMSLPKLECQDGSLDFEKSAFVEVSKVFSDIGQKMGTPLEASLEWKEQFKTCGFEEVTETKLQIPVGRWPKDKTLKKIGLFELANLDQGFEAGLLRGFTTVLNKTESELTVLTAEARKEMFDPKHHTSMSFVIVYGRKPIA